MNKTKYILALAALTALNIQAYTVKKEVIPTPEGTTREFVSPTDQTIVFQVVKDGKCRLDTPGGQGEEFDEVKSLVFSPDGKRFAAIVRDGERIRVVSDILTNSVSKRYEMVGDGFENHTNLFFSPDSMHLVYTIQAQDGTHVVYDGVESKQAYDNYNVTAFTFSPDSKHLAFRAWENARAIVDGREVKGTSICRQFLFSPDSQHLACFGNELWLDGNKQVGTKVLAPTFSPDSKHFAYVTVIDGNVKVIRDGKASAGFAVVYENSLTFSPDSQHLAFMAGRDGKAFLVQDAKEGKEYDRLPTGALASEPSLTQASIVFSPDSQHLAFTAKRGTKAFAVIDGKEGPAFSEAVGLICGPTNQFVYMGYQGSTAKVFVGFDYYGYGEDLLDQTAPRFSPDGKHIISTVDTVTQGIVSGTTLFIDKDKVELPCYVNGNQQVAFDGPNRILAIGKEDDKWCRVEVSLSPEK